MSRATTGVSLAIMQQNDLFVEWPPGRKHELTSAGITGRVGTVLVSETDTVRVWHLHLRPAERFGFHRHVLDYFWTVLSPGRARSYYEDGSVRDVTYELGDTKHFTFGPGEHTVHDLENIGLEPLIFVTVEFKGGSNRPLDDHG